jgi:hypothetical protein
MHLGGDRNIWNYSDTQHGSAKCMHWEYFRRGLGMDWATLIAPRGALYVAVRKQITNEPIIISQITD